MRLNRFLASAGLGSRRSCEDLIRNRRVVINGSRVESLSTLVAPDDDVRVDGKRILSRDLTYVVFYKPAGVLTTRSDPQGRQTIYDILPPPFQSLAYVGRLDKESEGLLLLTNDGILSQHLTHPSHEMDKEYEVVLDRPFQQDDLKPLLTGFHIEGGRAKMEKVYSISPTKLRITLRQGMKRQIRLMLAERGYEVRRLRRTRMGSLRLGSLHRGQWRKLTPREVDQLSSPLKKSSPPRKP